MKKLELNQMENLEGGDLKAICAVTGFLFFAAYAAGPVFGATAGAIASTCWNN
jgi:hypothetical protein